MLRKSIVVIETIALVAMVMHSFKYMDYVISEPAIVTLSLRLWDSIRCAIYRSLVKKGTGVG